MADIQQLKKEYLKDVQLCASKSKFGFFNIPAPLSAGDQVFGQKTVCKDQNGRVKTQLRNIFSGLCATGVLKKSFFQYTPSYKAGDLYNDPGKVDRTTNLKTLQKFKDKQQFKPASLNKTLMSSSYQYVPQKQIRKDPKLLRDQNGRVKVQNGNIMSSPSAKIDWKKTKDFKYIGQSYQNARLMRRKQLFQDIKHRGQAPFKPSSPMKDFFTSPKQQFKDIEAKIMKQNKQLSNCFDHDSKFKPSNHYDSGTFSKLEYIPQGDGKKQGKKFTTNQQKKDPFKLIKVQKNSKPSPSICYSKMNLMRSFR